MVSQVDQADDGRISLDTAVNMYKIILNKAPFFLKHVDPYAQSVS